MTKASVAAVMVLGLCAAHRQDTPNAFDSPVIVPSQPAQWIRYRVDARDRAIGVYLMRDDRPKPLVVLIHGSGCGPIMTISAAGELRDTSLFQDVVASRSGDFHFALVEKRGVQPLVFAAGTTRDDRLKAFERAQQECSPEFMRHVTKPARVEDVLATVMALSRERWVTSILMAGHSEGTHVATGILRAMKQPPVAAAGLFASAGPMPFYAGYAARGPDVARFQQTLDRVRMLQSADDDFLYQGLPARRWKTFWLDGTPIDDVRDSVVPLFVAQGTRDGATLAADLFVLEATRQQPTRRLRYVVVEGGDHAFETPNGERLGRLFDDFLQWAADSARQTSVHVLK